jgi:uncharacterized protein with HEPN domain
MRDERPVVAWLSDARRYANEARDLAGAQTNDRDYLAIRYCLLIVGEALDGVHADVLAQEPDIPWRQVIALRHRLVHAYWLIDRDIIMEIARHETGQPIAALDRMIESLQ